jgi:adenine deaminase
VVTVQAVSASEGMQGSGVVVDCRGYIAAVAIAGETAAGIRPARALRAATGTAAELLGRKDIGVLEPGRAADIVAMRGDPIADISHTAEVDFVMRSGHLHRIPDDSSARTAALIGAADGQR